MGIQYVDVWKNANELGKTAGAAALELCKGTRHGSLTLPDGLIEPAVAPAARTSAQPFTTPGRQHRQVVHPEADAAHRREPQPGGRRRLDHQGEALRGVDAAKAPAACKWSAPRVTVVDDLRAEPPRVVVVPAPTEG